MNNFIKYALIRAIKTVCQTAIGLIPASAVISEVDWRLVASASILAGIVSILTSIATGLPEADYDEYINMDVEEPDDAEIFEDEDDDVELIMFDEELDDAEVFEDEDEE